MSRKSIMLEVLVVVSFALMVTVSAQGTTLLFRPAVGNFVDWAPLPPGYGNQVTSATQDGFLYDLVGGPTPNVVTQFATSGLPPVYTWLGDYGDLANVIFAQEPKVFEFDLIADPGFLVTLNSFDMATCSVTFVGCFDVAGYTINDVQVLDGDGNVLFSVSDPFIPSAGHYHFSFNGVTAETLRIMFDSTNVDSDDVGIGNINFSQEGTAVPEPGSLALLGCGLVVLGGAVRKRFRN
ncbi:MAG TPA: PEP-CTERM sorting domain-containing protein [Terriglobales bacterium]|nr:PEP-CTERM sorting domain-containing protein [Terriglobales bacterium]